jgi:hypothetical protein
MIAMNKKTVIVIGAIVVLAVSFAVVGYNWYRNSQVDTSWVETANGLLSNYHSYINDTGGWNSPITMSFIRMYTVGNGSSGLIYYGDGDKLSIYLTNLLKQANIQKGTVNWNQAEAILSSGKSVELTYRAGSAPGTFSDVPRKYNVAYFILDSQNEDMKGTIIAEGSTDRFDILAVSK